MIRAATAPEANSVVKVPIILDFMLIESRVTVVWRTYSSPEGLRSKQCV
jgi:hypothetical protein